jgi:ABC-type sugar transport system substrate-binding protein
MTDHSDARQPEDPPPAGLTRSTLIRRGLGGAGILSGAALLAACGGSGDDSAAATTPVASSSAAAGGQKRKVIWAIPAIADWNLPVDIGFIEATKQLGWSYQKVGVPLAQYAPETVVSTIRQATEAKPDILVTPGYVPGAYPAIEAAQKQGILVMLNDANNDPDAGARLGLARIGADEVAGGVALGQALVAAAKKNGKTSGTFVFGNPFPGNENLEAHGRGLKQAAGRQYDVVVYKEPSDPADAIAGYKAQITRIGGDLVGLSVNAGAPAVKALQESGKKPGDIVLGNFEDDVAGLERIKQGWMTAVVTSQSYAWGFVPTMLAWQALERGLAPRDYLTGKQIIDASNVDEFARQADEREKLAKQYHVRLA